MIAAAGNYMSSDTWTLSVVLVVVGFMALGGVVAWAAGRPGGGRRG